MEVDFLVIGYFYCLIVHRICFDLKNLHIYISYFYFRCF